MTNWTLTVNDGRPEVIPNNDLKGHNFYPMPCDCKPEFIKGVWVHAAFDNREAVERAEDLVNGDEKLQGDGK